MAFAWIAVQLGIAAGAFAVNWLNKKIDATPNPSPRPDEIEFPQVGSGTPLPYVFGTVRVSNSVLAWWGNSNSTELTTSVGPGVYGYSADMIYIVGVPFWDEATAPWSNWRSTSPPRLLAWWYGDIYSTIGGGGLAHGVAVPFSASTRGGEQIAGTMQFFDGRVGQVITAPTKSALLLAGAVESRIPGYEHQMLVGILTETGSGLFGYSSTIPSLAFEVECLGPYPVGQDANPAMIIYDLLCSPVWKLGFSANDINLAMFQTLAELLVEEEHGASLAIYQYEDAVRIIGDLLAQINAVLYENPSTGKIEIVAIREVSAIGLPTVDADNTVAKPSITVSGWRGKATGMNVEFTNRSNFYKPETLPSERLANAAAASGRRTVMTAKFQSCTNASLAARLSAREMGLMGRPLVTAVAKVNREFYDTLPGDALVVDWPDRQINNMTMRVLSVDHGQLAKGEIVLSLIEDVFSEQEGAFPQPPDPLLPFLLPIHERLLSEAPAWMQRKLYDAGILTATSDQDLAYAFAVAANPDDTYAQSVKTLGTSLFGGSALTDDVPLSLTWRWHATVKTEYPRTAEPYDTSVGLELEDVSTGLQSTLDDLGAGEYTDNLIANYAWSLGVLYDPLTDEHEFVAFKSQESITDGRKLTKVWRGLLDTSPQTWPVGTRFVFLRDFWNVIGRSPRFVGAEVDEQFVPSGSALTGSGDDPIDAIEIIGRQAKPLSVSDFAVAGPDVEGTEGIGSAFTGYKKAVSLFDGHAFAQGNRRSREDTEIVRGDSAAAPAESEHYSLVAEKVSGLEYDAEPDSVEILDSLVQPGFASYWALGRAGHGTIDVGLKTFTDDDDSEAFVTPRVRVEAPTWRNLLINSRGTSFMSTTPATTGWTNVTGTVQSSQGTSSPSQSATGTYWTSATAGSDPNETVFEQVVDVTGFKPEGLVAICDFYYRNFSDADDTVEVELQGLDENSDEVGSPATSTALVGDADLWTRALVELDIAATVSQVRVRVTLTGVSDATPSTALAEPTLRLGQATEQLLDNPTFEAEPAEYTLAFTTEADPDPVTEGGTINDIDITATVGGDTQTDLTITATLTWSAGGVRPSSPSNVDLGGWTAGTWTTSGGDAWVNTFTRASHSVGSSLIQLSVGAGTHEGTMTLTLSAGSSDQVADATESGDSVTILDTPTLSAAITSPADESNHDTHGGLIPLPCTLTVAVGGQNQTTASVTVEVADNYGSDHIDSIATTDLDGWTQGSAWAEAGGVWSATFTKASAAIGSYEIDFEVTYLAVFSNTTTIATSAASSTQVGSGSLGSDVDVNINDTGAYSLTAAVGGSPEPVEEGTDLAVDVGVFPSHTMTNLTLTITIQHSDPDAGFTEPDDDELDGWTQVGSWSFSSDTWTGVFTIASLGTGGSGLDFGLLAGAPGTITLACTIGSDQVPSGMTSGDVVTVEAAASWTVDATSGIAYPADSTEMGDFLTENALSMPAPTSIYTCQDASGGAVDANGTRNMSAVGSLVYEQAVAGHSRLGISIPQAANSYLTNNSVANLNTSSGLLLAITVVTDANALRSILAMGASVVDAGILQLAAGQLRADNSAGTSDGANQCPFGVAAPYGYHHDVDGSLSYGFHDTEHESPTYGAIASSTRIWIGSCGGTSSPQVVTYMLWWEGANAEAAAGCTRANLKAFLQAMGFTITWTP